MNKKKISIEDVARRAKVSITTVSRVINNFPTVSVKNRNKVEEAIAALKFKPNVSAQRLAKGLNDVIGLVMPGYPGIFHSFYAIEIIRGIGHACESLRLDMIFHITNGFNPLNSNTVGGMIFADIIENRKQVEQAVSIGTPALIINNRVEDLDVHYIAVDNAIGGQLAAEYLVSLGHKKIATITGNLNTQGGKERNEGYLSYLCEKNINIPEYYFREGDYSRRCARSATEFFLSLDERPTAIFAASDEMALEVIATLLEKGVNVPSEISVIGFDDNPACLYGPVALTTVKQPLFKMAEESVRILVKIMQGKIEGLHQEVLHPELIVRESCATPPD